MSPLRKHSAASVNRPMRNSGSFSARALIVSTKSLVSAIALPLALPSSVIFPVPFGVHDIAALPLLRPATKQDHQRLAVFGEIDPVAGTEMDLVFADSFTDRLDIREVAVLQPSDGRPHLQSRRRVERLKPLREWVAAM